MRDRDPYVPDPKRPVLLSLLLDPPKPEPLYPRLTPAPRLPSEVRHV